MGKFVTSGELVVKAQYLCSIQVDTNWYWNQQPKQHVITVPTHTHGIRRITHTPIPSFVSKRK